MGERDARIHAAEHHRRNARGGKPFLHGLRRAVEDPADRVRLGCYFAQRGTGVAQIPQAGVVFEL